MPNSLVPLFQSTFQGNLFVKMYFIQLVPLMGKCFLLACFLSGAKLSFVDKPIMLLWLKFGDYSYLRTPLQFHSDWGIFFTGQVL